MTTQSPAYIFVYANSNSPRWGVHDAVTFAGKTIPANLPGIGQDVAVSNHGKWVAFAHSSTPYVTIKLMSTLATISGGPSSYPAGTGSAVSWNRDDSILAVGSWSYPYIILYNTSDWSKRADLSVLPNNSVNCLKFSPDGSKLAVACDATPYILIYETTTWTKIDGPLTIPTNSANHCEWSPDGSKLAVGHYGSTYFTIYNTSDWSVVSGTPNNSFPGSIWGISWHPDNTKIAFTHSNSPYVTVFNLSDWSKMADPVSLPANEGNCIAYSPDGLWLAIGVYSSSPYHAIYNAATMEKRANLSPLPAGSVWGVAWGPLTVGRGNDQPWDDAAYASAGNEQPYDDCVIVRYASTQPYDDAIKTAALEQLWDDCAIVKSALDQRYNISVGMANTQSYSAYVSTFSDQQWEDCSFASKASEHGYNISIGAALQQPYGAPITGNSIQPIHYTVDRANEQGWSILHSLAVASDQPWAFTSTINVAMEQSWDALPRNPVIASCDQPYSLSDPPVLLTTGDATLLHRGQPLSFLAAEFVLAEGDTFWTGTIQLAHLADYAAIQLDDALLFSQGGFTWHFIADRKGMNRSGANAPRMNVSIISPTAARASPRTPLISRTWETSTLASTAATDAAGVAIEWGDLVDWLIPPNKLAVHQADPIKTASKIVEAAGGLLETLPDGTLRARHLFPVRVPDWATATPDHTITDTSDIFSLEESYLLTRRVDSIAIASREAGTGYLSLAADDRPDGLNSGRSSFHPGETVFLLVVAGPGVVVEGLDASAGVIAPEGVQSWEETEEIIFDNASQVTLHNPTTAITSTTWRGRSLGTLTLDDNGMTLKAASAGTAVASVRYTIQAMAYSLTLPADLGVEEDVSVTVRASGLEPVQGDAVVCSRGTATHLGEAILEPLLNGLPSLLSRGRAEIDTGEPLRSIRIDTHFHGGILPGQLVEVQEALTSTTWRGKVTSAEHRIANNRSTTSLELMRHVPTTD